MTTHHLSILTALKPFVKTGKTRAEIRALVPQLSDSQFDKAFAVIKDRHYISAYEKFWWITIEGRRQLDNERDARAARTDNKCPCRMAVIQAALENSKRKD